MVITLAFISTISYNILFVIFFISTTMDHHDVKCRYLLNVVIQLCIEVDGNSTAKLGSQYESKVFCGGCPVSNEERR